MITPLTNLYNCRYFVTIAHKMNKLHLLLASQSPRRRELIALLGLPFQMTAANVPEAPLPGEPPTATAARLSQAKARATCLEHRLSPVGSTAINRLLRTTTAINHLLRTPTAINRLLRTGPRPFAYPHLLIVACDTIVALDGQTLGKPRDHGEAQAMLRRLRGRPHAVYTAVTLLESATGRTVTDVAQTQLTMRPYTDAEIAAYVASRDPLDKAGAYAIQNPDFRPVARYRGCYANVVGLPLCHLTRCLHALGIEPSSDVPTACQTHTGRHCPVYTTILQSLPNGEQ